MVLHKYGDKLYHGLREVVNKHLKDVADTVANTIDDNFLDAVNNAWSDHKISMLMIRDILMYMVCFCLLTLFTIFFLTSLCLLQDRVYVMHNNVAPVYDLGLQLFSDNLTRNVRIKDRLLKQLLAAISKERGGEVVNRALLKNITQMLVDLGINSRTVYEEDFERHFLDTSANFYRHESQAFIAENSCSEYMKKVDLRLKEEMERVQHYLDASTEAKIKEVTERELISNHMKNLVEMDGSGEVSMLKDDKLEGSPRPS